MIRKILQWVSKVAVKVSSRVFESRRHHRTDTINVASKLLEFHVHHLTVATVVLVVYGLVKFVLTLNRRGFC